MQTILLTCLSNLQCSTSPPSSPSSSWSKKFNQISVSHTTICQHQLLGFIHLSLWIIFKHTNTKTQHSNGKDLIFSLHILIPYLASLVTSQNLVQHPELFQQTVYSSSNICSCCLH
ncbi:hypothetical protein ILYODFUR_028447 [Ilyodon furcidens]|uniref:Uncharacterized protein n=1 Tax=Ilyodon furcidens TaxID=33524 RepID=A0ABV0UL83_9TELE